MHLAIYPECIVKYEAIMLDANLQQYGNSNLHFLRYLLMDNLHYFQRHPSSHIDINIYQTQHFIV